MLHNSLTHMISTPNSISFPVVPGRRAEQPPPLSRSFHQLLRWPAAAVRGCPSLAVDNKSGGGDGMSWFYELEEEVREYELDRFGVVNNSVYNNYCEYGTFKLLEKIGFDADTRLAVAELSTKYIAPLRMNDRLLLKLRILDYSTTRLYLEIHIVKLPNHETILRAAATLVHINENQRPARFTHSMISKYNKFLLAENNK